MANFYWVGGGCVDRKGLSTNSNMKWGISQFDFNNPNNWIVHYGNFVYPFTVRTKIGQTKSANIGVDVYVRPTRAPGPIDNVIVGHYPWFRNRQIVNNGKSAYLTTFDDRFYNSGLWYSFDTFISPGESIPVFFSGTGSDANGFMTKQINVPRAVSATEINTPIYTSINDDPTGVATTVQSALVTLLSQAGVVYSSGITAGNCSGYCVPNYSQFANNDVASHSFEFANSPLLYGGVIQTSYSNPIGLTTDTSTTWLMGGTNGANVGGITGFGLHRFVVVNYGNTIRGTVMGVSGSNLSPIFTDHYPYTSVGDGLWGKNNATVIESLRTGINNGVGCTGVSGSTYFNVMTAVQNKTLTADNQYNWSGLRIKAREIVNLTPMWWNKWPHPNYEGRIVTVENKTGNVSYAYNDTLPFGKSGIPAGVDWLQSGLNKFNTLNEYSNYNNLLGSYLVPVSPYSPYGGTGGSKWIGAHTKNSFLDKEVNIRVLPMTLTGSYQGRVATTVNSHTLHGTYTFEEGWFRGNWGTPFASAGEQYARSLFQLEKLEDRVYKSNGWYPPVTAKKSVYDKDFVPDNSSGFSPVVNPFWPSKSQHYVGIGNNTTGNSPILSEENKFSNTSVTVFPEVYHLGWTDIRFGPGDIHELSARFVKPSDIGISGGEYGSIENNNYPVVIGGHGYPVANTNSYGGSQGNIYIGSSYTADSIILSAVSVSKFDTDIAKSGSVTLWGNTNIGDIELENTNLSIYSSVPNDTLVQTPQYDMISGDRLVDRVLLQKDSDIDMTEDSLGAFRVGRILGSGITLGSGATSGTAGIFGGIVFDSDRDQAIRPAANSRWWVSSIPGNQYDLRQTQFGSSYISPETSLYAFPNSMDVNGFVASTGLKDFNAYVNAVPEFSEYVAAKNHNETLGFSYAPSDPDVQAM